MKEFLSKYFKGDPVIWAVVVGMSIFSLLAVYSSTGTLAYKYHEGNTLYYLMKHFSFLLFGIGVIFVTHLVPYKVYSGLAPLLLILALILLPLTLLMGTNINHASRWLTLPGGITFQTSDFAKLALLIYIARVLARNQDNIKDFKSAFQPIMIAVVLVCLFIFPANFSTAALLFTTSWIVMFIGRINLKYLFGTVALVLVGGAMFGTIIFYQPDILPRGATWKSRIENFTSGDSDGNFQAEQAKIAVATGGIFGKLPGNSTQRNFLPHPYSDFIYAIIIEEYGFVGAAVVMLLYLILLYRAGIVVKNSERTFPAFLAIGLTFMLVFQAMINMAVAVNLFPVTGQPLPFISMGGTSILFTSVAIGILLGISRDYQKKGIQ